MLDRGGADRDQQQQGPAGEEERAGSKPLVLWGAYYRQVSPPLALDLLPKRVHVCPPPTPAVCGAEESYQAAARLFAQLCGPEAVFLPKGLDPEEEMAEMREEEEYKKQETETETEEQEKLVEAATGGEKEEAAAAGERVSPGGSGEEGGRAAGAAAAPGQ